MISYAAALLTSSPHQCRSPLCYWLQWSCLMCCCHPAGSLPPPSDSPNHHQTVPEQKVTAQSQKFKHHSVESAKICFFPVNQYETDIPGEHTRPLYSLCSNRTDINLLIASLTLESSSCVLSSSSSPFLVLLIVVWLSSSHFIVRGSLSEEVGPVASFRSGGEELRDV